MELLAKTISILCLLGATSTNHSDNYHVHRNLEATEGNEIETIQSDLTSPPSIPVPTTYWHNYVGDDGLSHFIKCPFDWSEQSITKGITGPTWLSFITPQALPNVTNFIFGQMYIANGTYNDWHADPGPQFVVVMQGRQGWEAEDGQKLVLEPGDVYFGEDQITTSGKGHVNFGLGEMLHFLMVRFDNHIPRKGQPCWPTSNSTSTTTITTAQPPAPAPPGFISPSTSRIDKIKLELAHARAKGGLEDDSAIAVCVGADNLGLSVRNTDGEYFGFEVDVAKLVVADLEKVINQKLNIVFVSPTLDERLQYLVTQRCAFLADLLTNIPERREVVSFTNPYLVISEEILAFKSANITSPEDCDSFIVAAGSATLVHYEESFPAIRRILTDSNSAGLDFLLNGTAKCMANDNIVFMQLLNEIDVGVHRGAYPGVESTDLERISTGNLFPPKPWGLGLSDDTPWLLKELTSIMIYAAASGRLESLREVHGFADGFASEPAKSQKSPNNCSCPAAEGCNIVETPISSTPPGHTTCAITSLLPLFVSCLAASSLWA